MKGLIFLRDEGASAAVEMALVTPILLALLFGSVELGNFFMTEHAVEKGVRDGARYAARLPFAATYTCTSDPATVFADPGATNNIINVTKTGAVSGTGFPRLDASYWDRTCGTDTQTVTVSVSCVDKDNIDTENTGNTGIYTGLSGTKIPVVTVSARVKYLSVLGTLGFKTTNLCLNAESKAALQGL
jgi:Flp pilus assembly protein TadG